MFKRLIMLFLLITAVFTASADVFTVTSNADAGTGTLREALTLAAANGSAVKDYITFNLPDVSEAGRTITLKSALPYVSSNLVIDGSTQPGLPFGVSNAKVALFFQTDGNTPLSGLRIAGVSDVIILSLYIKDTSDLSEANMSYFRRAIDIIDSNNIHIGEPGKGNVITGFYYSLSTNWFNTGSIECRNIFLKSNFFNIDKDGETVSLNPEEPVNLSNVAGRIEVGGKTIAEGNLLANGLMISQEHSSSPYDTISANFLIQNNIMGLDYKVEKMIAKSKGLYIGTVDPNGTNTIDIFDNVITNPNGYGIFIINNGRKASILRNYIGTDKTRQKTFKNLGIGIFVYSDNEIAIGSANPADANYITNCNPVLIWPYTNATVNKNSFYCITDAAPMRFVGYGATDPPVINITTFTATSVAGTASPNSVIELFYSDNCGTCSPQTYFATVNADATGKWIYNGPITGTVIASATFGMNTSDFTQVSINATNVNIINACEDKGSITGLVVSNAKNVKWLNEQGETVNTSIDLINVPPGKYKLIAENGECGSSTGYYEIITKFKLVTATLIIKQTSCGNSNGGISGISIINNEYDAPKISWKDQAGQEKGTAIDLTGVPAGQYTLTVTSADGTCVKTYGPTTITNIDGPAINTTSLIKEDAHCDIADGSIKNIQVTGTGTYLWTNEQGTDVGHNKDLTGVPAGKYKLTVSSAGCPPVSTAFIDILEINGITIDDTKRVISQATCQYDDGGISKIQVTGATKYTWYNSGNILVSNNLDLTNAPTGDYHLIAANDNGCSKQTAVYTITRQAPVSYSGVTKKLNNATCDENNGSIELIFENTPAQLPESYKWVNPATGQAVITSTPIVTGIDAGKYDIYGTTNGCEQYIISYSIGRDPGLTVVTNSVNVNDDHCSSGTGSIKGTLATGKTPLSFTWTDDNGINKGALADLLNVPAGTYHLKVTDGSNCEQGFVYTVYDQSDALLPPNVSDVQLCSPGDALLSVSNTDSRYRYRLYEDNNSAAPIDEQQSGRFKVNVKANRSYYISQYFGNCESLREEVKVLISGLSGTDIANTFTPNSDGINDYWKIKGMENYTNSTVKVFNRDGKMVFQSKGYATPFDGTLNGKPLPVGVYYYIIDLQTCDLLSGNLTILR